MMKKVSTDSGVSPLYYDLRCNGSIIAFWMSKWKKERTMEASSAVPNPPISNASPIIAAVIINVIALITKKNNPSVRIVTGNVKRIKIGRTNILRMERMRLAMNAAPTPLKWIEAKYPSIAINKTVFTRMLISQFIMKKSRKSNVSFL